MRFLPIFLLAWVLAGCDHPLHIVGEGDILSASGDRDCLLEESEAAASNCANNTITGDYQETYFGVPRSGWKFHRWANYCADADYGGCSFDVPASYVHAAADGGPGRIWPCIG